MSQYRGYILLGVLQSYAPSAAAEDLCRAIHTKMVTNDEPDSVIESQTVSAIRDGLVYGNWPWDDLRPITEGSH